MPVGDVLVGDSGCDIKHDDTALSVDVVSITKTTKLLLTGSIPNIELNLAQVLLTVRDCSYSRSQRVGGKVTYRSKAKRMDLNTESSDILLLELTSQMALDKRGL